MKVLAAILAAIALGVTLYRRHHDQPAKGPMTPEQTNAMLAELAPSVPEATDWRESIVDLMKILRLDSSFDARAELAAGLDMPSYRGSNADNIALHKAVMAKAAAHKLG